MDIFFIFFMTSLVFSDLLSGVIHCFCKIYEKDEPKEYSFKEIVTFAPETSFIASLLLRNSRRKFKINILYIVIAITTIALTLLLAQQYPDIKQLIAALIFTYTLIALTFIDAKTQILPDLLTKPLIVLGLVQGYFGIFTDIKSSVIGAVVGYGVFWSINALFKLIRNKEGMGGGDFKLLAAIGAWAGYMNLPLVIMLSSFVAVIGAVITAPLIGKKITQPLPYGPYLAISGLIALCFGQQIVAAYLQMVGI